MSEETVHESKGSRSRQAIATYFRRISDALRRGEPVPADETGTVAVDPGAEPDLAVDVERNDDGTVSMAVEMEWPEEEGTVDTDALTSKATFRIYEDAEGKWRWRLVHRNGNIISDGSEGYASKQKAKQGLESVKKNVPGAHVIDESKDEEPPEEGGSDATAELFADAEGKWRWRLVHDNGNIIADGSQGYSSKQKAKQGLNSVKANAPGAPVEDVDE